MEIRNVCNGRARGVLWRDDLLRIIAVPPSWGGGWRLRIGFPASAVGGFGGVMLQARAQGASSRDSDLSRPSEKHQLDEEGGYRRPRGAGWAGRDPFLRLGFRRTVHEERAECQPDPVDKFGGAGSFSVFKNLLQLVHIPPPWFIADWNPPYLQGEETLSAVDEDGAGGDQIDDKAQVKAELNKAFKVIETFEVVDALAVSASKLISSNRRRWSRCWDLRVSIRVRWLSDPLLRSSIV
eukprot:762703-Hanusia_phi.AAC.2